MSEKKVRIITNTFTPSSSMEFWPMKWAKTQRSLSIKFLKYWGHVLDFLDLMSVANRQIKKIINIQSED